MFVFSWREVDVCAKPILPEDNTVEVGHLFFSVSTLWENMIWGEIIIIIIIIELITILWQKIYMYT